MKRNEKMGRCLLMSSVVLAFACSVVFAGRQVTMGGRDYALAVRDGAKARFTFRVVDEVSSVVSGATVQVSFGRDDSRWIKGVSGRDGLYTVEGISSGKILYDVDKAGYYKTSSECCFGGEGNIRVEDGKWLPWNPTNTVILKSVKNPVALYARSWGASDDILIPLKGTNVAFDMEKGDWVAPHGQGQNGDLIVNCDEQASDPWTGFRKLTLTFGANTLDGVRRYKLDSFSRMRSIYEAPVDGYEKTVTWALEVFRTKKDIINAPPADEYFVFRVRTEVDDQGKIVKANYGKIYGPVQYGNLGGRLVLRMTYYFNPEVNSRNLEFDPKKNLSGQRISTP